MNRKRYLIGTITLVALISLCLVFAGALTAAASEKKGKVIEMTLAHADVADPTNLMQAAALAFKEYVEAESGGNIKVNISPGGALGNAASLQEMTMKGEIQASMSQCEGTMAIVYPNIQIISIPYLFDSIDQALSVFRGDFGERLFEDMRKATGLRVNGVWDNGGFRSFTNSKHPVHTPEDMKGLKIRTMDIPAHMTLVRSLGAQPTPISWSELYTALQTGVVDGQENAIPTILLGSLQEVQKYLILDGHVYTQQHMLMNDAWFNGLSPEYQKIVLQGGREAGYAGQRACRVLREIGEQILSKHLEIYHPTLEEKAQFRQLTQEPVLKFIRKQVTDRKWIDEVLLAAKDANKSLGYTK